MLPKQAENPNGTENFGSSAVRTSQKGASGAGMKSDSLEIPGDETDETTFFDQSTHQILCRMTVRIHELVHNLFRQQASHFKGFCLERFRVCSNTLGGLEIT